MAYKILVVDDDSDAMEFLVKGLLRNGYEVVSACDGEEALAKIKTDDPDVILLDLVMPKLNGVEVLREVRRKFNDKWRPVIIVSAKTELESFKQCYGLDADHYLTKPCNMDNILRGIETMLSLIPLRKQS